MILINESSSNSNIPKDAISPELFSDRKSYEGFLKLVDKVEDDSRYGYKVIIDKSKLEGFRKSQIKHIESMLSTGMANLDNYDDASDLSTSMYKAIENYGRIIEVLESKVLTANYLEAIDGILKKIDFSI